MTAGPAEAAGLLAGALAAGGVVLTVAELFRRAPAPGRPPSRLVKVRHLSSTSRRRVALAVLAALGTLLVTGWPVAALAAFGAVIGLPRLTSGREARHRIELLEGLEQWVRRLADLLSASRALEDALAASARTAPAAVAPAVTALAASLRQRTGTEQALRDFAERLADPAGDRIAAALIIATGNRGGSVRGVLGALAEMLAADVASRREIEAERAQHRTTTRWIAAFVAGFTVFAVLNRSYSEPYQTAPGEVVLALVCALYAGGLWWLYRLGLMPAPGRFLAEDAGAPPREHR